MEKATSRCMISVVSVEIDVDQSEKSAGDLHPYITVEILPKSQKTKRTKYSRATRCLQGFKNFHFKNWYKSNKILILFRLLSIVGLIVFGLIDTVMYSSKSKDKPDALKFIHGLRYIPTEIVTMIYASGVAAFGICIEVYLLLLHGIINGVLLARTCDGTEEATNEIIWIIKLICLFLAVELCHRNFRKLVKYNDHFNSSARSMLRQALLLGATMFVENLTGLRALYRATNTKLPRMCKYETSHCGIVNLYEPLFGYDDDVCSDDLADYATGRERIRLLRNFILLNIASYSVFNKHFFKIKSNAKYLQIRILLIILFLALATSIPVSYVDPLFFIQNCRLAYNIIEVIIFVIILGLMAFNLYKLRNKEENILDGEEEMARLPSLLP